MREYSSIQKPAVLTFVRYYLPAYKAGGPVRTIANLVDHLGDRFLFRVVCTDRDSFDTEPFRSIDSHNWNSVGLSEVLYAPRRHYNLLRLVKLIGSTPHDIVYLNSFFDYRFSILPLLAVRILKKSSKPVVIAPRGEFSRGALDIRKIRKRFFILISKAVGIHRHLVWQASSRHEVRDIERVMGNHATFIRVAPNLAERFDNSVTRNITNLGPGYNPLRVVFLSRISPMKNVAFALRILEEVRCSVVLDLYGLIDDEQYWKGCLDIVRKLPNHIQVEYKGIVDHDRVRTVLADYDLFLLPTRGENYGHAILEALTVGTPVLISDRTPWRDLSTKGVGWTLPLSRPDSFVQVLEQVSTESSAVRRSRRDRAISYARGVITDPEAIEANFRLFNNLLRDYCDRPTSGGATGVVHREYG